MERKSEELPYHIEKLGDTERLQSCLVDRAMFGQLYAEDRKLQLMAYWRNAGGYDVAAKLNVAALRKQIEVCGVFKWRIRFDNM